MPSRYERVIALAFEKSYFKGATEVAFQRELLVECADELGIKVPKNVGDIIYTFRYRQSLPKSVVDKAPKGMNWVIQPDGDARYKFVAVKASHFISTVLHEYTKIPDATPGIIIANALGDEQALLARLRYNRLIDIFLRMTCYSLQNHLRTKVKGVGQIEVDELYLGIDRSGAQYVIPVQAKGGKDKHSVVQIEQDIRMCQEKFPTFTCRSVGAQFMEDGIIALLEFKLNGNQVVQVGQAHYKLVHHSEISPEELASYRQRSTADDLA